MIMGSLSGRVERLERAAGLEAGECSCAPSIVVFSRHQSDDEFIVGVGGQDIPIVADGERCPKCGLTRHVTTCVVGGVDLGDL